MPEAKRRTPPRQQDKPIHVDPQPRFDAGSSSPGGKGTGLLDSKDKIRKYLGVTDYMLRKFVSSGMPVLIEDNRWLAHIDNLEDFFRKYTRVDSRQKLDEIPCQAQNACK